MLKKRFNTIIIIIGIIFCIIIARLIYLQVFKYQFYKEKSNNQLKRIIPLSAQKGNILDRNKKKLATMKKSYSFYALPQEINNKWEYSKQVSAILQIPRKKIFNKINKNKKFIWIKRHCNQKIHKKLTQLNLKGLEYIIEKKRIYPEQTLASHVIGFVGIDNQGLSGIEYKFDETLKGQKGKLILQKDPKGNQLITGKRKVIQPHNGQNIVTTIDTYIQHISEKHLKWGVEKFNAKNGTVVVLDPKSGDVLAMCSTPTFNPNSWNKEKNTTLKNSAILNVFEPGSVLKIFTIAAAINEDIVTSDTIIEVPPQLKLGKHTIKEAHPPEPGTPLKRSVSDILTYSLNVGTSKIAMKLGKKKLYSYLHQFGFGKKTQVELPGEQKGLFNPPSKWSGIDIAMISFGQGMACTALQLTTATATIANQGHYIKPRIIKYFTDQSFQTRKAIPVQQQHQILKKTTAQQITKIMVNVVENGTATPVKIKGYQIAGKTGTAQKASSTSRGYLKNKYIATFVGFFPAQNPRVVILVSLNEPSPVIWGGYTSGKIFKKIAWDIINYLKIPPSNNQRITQATDLN